MNLEALKRNSSNFTHRVVNSELTIQEIELKKIIPDPNQPRKEFDPEQLSELAESIKEHGLIQPILLRKISADQYVVIAGERRFRAVSLNGSNTIKAIVKNNTDEKELGYLQVAENLKRADLNVNELAEFVCGRIELGESQTYIAKNLGIRKEQISKLAAWAEMPPCIREAYLTAANLRNLELTEKEESAIANLNNLSYAEFKVTDIFDVNNTSNLLSRDIVENSGTTPYLCASAENNSVSSYISYNSSFLNKGNCVFIGGKTFVVTYQRKDFFSNDSHNLALYLKNKDFSSEENLLALVTYVIRSLKHLYSWGDSISNSKIQTDVITLPVKDGKPDYESMKDIISATKKLVIKDVVEFADKKITAAKQTIGE